MPPGIECPLALPLVLVAVDRIHREPFAVEVVRHVISTRLRRGGNQYLEVPLRAQVLSPADKPVALRLDALPA